MRRSEARWLAAGLVIGLLSAASAFMGWQYVVSRRAATPATASMPNEPIPAVAQPGDGPVAVALTEDEQRSAGIETVEVNRQNIRKEITAPGKVAEAETGIGVISARIAGRVDRLLLNVTGESVSRGQAVAQIYSPEVFTAAEEYRLALVNRQQLSSSKEPQAIIDAEELIRASRRRLELWGLTPRQLDEITSSPQDSTQTTIYSSISGVVTKRHVVEGQYVAQGDVLYTVADLSTVWVQADIFETDIPSIRSGQVARITAPGMTGTLRGTINFLQPAVDSQTRTMEARLQVANPQMRLKPGMFVQIAIDAPVAGNVIAVPRSAVLETGQEKVVYVAQANGVFEKRPIEASAAGDDFYAVTKGLEPGERVVTHGNFLLDSQTRLTGGITGMFGGSKAFDTASANYTISFRSEPSAPKGAEDGTFHVSVTDPDGKPVTDAQVQVNLLMPAMPSMGMGEMRSAFNLAWNGAEYSGKGTISMAGPWNVTVEARRGGQLLGVHRTRFDAK